MIIAQIDETEAVNATGGLAIDNTETETTIGHMKNLTETPREEDPVIEIGIAQIPKPD